MKNYQVYVSSLTTGSGSATEDQTYKFDWSIFPEGEYEMTFAFISKGELISNTEAQQENMSVMIEIQVPFSTDKYKALDNGNANSTHLCGFLSFYDTQHHSGNLIRQYRATATDNPPVILRGKPQGYEFRVRTLQSSGTNVGEMYSYDLLMNFKYIGKC
jgi:hypothetical protein